jgi:hypothetical protein
MMTQQQGTLATKGSRDDLAFLISLPPVFQKGAIVKQGTGIHMRQHH